MGEQGPFQRFERSEISQDEFYRDFGRRLSDVDKGNEAYKAYCKGARIGAFPLDVFANSLYADAGSRVTDCPPLPTNVQIDGKEVRTIHLMRASDIELAVRSPLTEDYYAQLWAMMMDPALEPDEIIVTAINRLRGELRLRSPLGSLFRLKGG